jgi:hypothetical protein
VVTIDYLKGVARVAIFHCGVSVIGRKAGRGAIASAAYRAGQKLQDERTGKIYDYSRRKGVVYTNIVAPQNAPDWVSDRAKLWNAVEASEKRKDSQVAREIMLALPAELDSSQRIKLIRRYIFEQFTKAGMIADFAIHAPSRQGDERNYHVHIMLTTRTITSAGFGGKARQWNAKSCIYQWRQAWERHANQALEAAGFDCRIDGRSHASRGLDLEPRLHLGHQETALERMGEASERGNQNRAIEARNAQREKLRNELAKTEREWGVQSHHSLSSQAMPRFNAMQDSENKLEDAGAAPDKLVEMARPQKESYTEFLEDFPENRGQSLDEHKQALERISEAFEARKEELNCQIINAVDSKTQDRLRLKGKLESALFAKTYSERLANLLQDADPQKYAHEVIALQREAAKSGKAFKKYANEWDLCAVRDEAYSPRNQDSADKINTFREKERQQWAHFALKAEKNGWAESRIEEERQALQKMMDQQLTLSFGLKNSLSYAKNREI